MSSARPGSRPAMDTVHEDLLRIERALAPGDAGAYRRHLAPEAVVVVPGAALDRDACVAAIEQAPPWDDWTIEAPRTLALGDGAAVLTYGWRSRRGEQAYAALMSSVYARRDGAWRLVLHQQTPLPE